HFRNAKHAGTGTGHRHAHPPPDCNDVDPDDRVTRGRVAEFLVVPRLHLRKAHGGDDLVRIECGLEQTGEEIVGGDFALVGTYDGVERHHRGWVVGSRVVV